MCACIVVALSTTAKMIKLHLDNKTVFNQDSNKDCAKIRINNLLVKSGNSSLNVSKNS